MRFMSPLHVPNTIKLESFQFIVDWFWDFSVTHFEFREISSLGFSLVG